MVYGFDGSRAFVSNRTGTENYSFQLLKALKIDKKNKYIVYLRPFANVKKQNWPSNFHFTTLDYPYLWTQIGLALQTFKDHLDVLFVPAHTLPIIRKPGLKTVVTVHDLGSEYLPQTHQYKQRLYLGFMQKAQLKTATRIIAVSQATKNDLVKKIKLNQEKIDVVYEGYDKNLFKPVRNDLLVNSLKQYDLKPKSYFLFIGTIQPRKNLDRIIKAFSKSNVNKLVIVGQKGWLSEEIYKLPKQLGVEDRVKFLGFVPEKDLPILYSGALALIFASLFEGFGLPIIEAQACECPVLTSNLSSMPEIAGKEAILVDPYSENDIVEGMDKIQNSQLRSKIIKAGLVNINRFSWERCARETLEVLEK